MTHLFEVILPIPVIKSGEDQHETEMSKEAKYNQPNIIILIIFNINIIN